jgi:hypothetical protein
VTVATQRTAHFAIVCAVLRSNGSDGRPNFYLSTGCTWHLIPDQEPYPTWYDSGAVPRKDHETPMDVRERVFRLGLSSKSSERLPVFAIWFKTPSAHGQARSHCLYFDPDLDEVFRYWTGELKLPAPSFHSGGVDWRPEESIPEDYYAL